MSEWDYILNNLECLEPNSICIAIIPISCVIDDPLKSKVLEKHTLEAVFSMPVDLFHDSKANTVTCVVVLKAKSPHAQNKKTWLGYCRDDGFIKAKNLGRIDKNERWINIKEKWITLYKNKEEEKGFSLMTELSAKDEWCVEAYLETDYSKISEADFEKVVKNHIAYRIKNDV